MGIYHGRNNWGLTGMQEFFWSFPDLEPLYNAARSYLEISQRIDLLNARVDVGHLSSEDTGIVSGCCKARLTPYRSSKTCSSC